tara:strand:+ start:533 stop:1231 length:699 start_codon:yes stop_codon:yes gene_type:complete
MDNTAIVVTARLDSRRLPRKALSEIGGKPMLSRVLDRVARANDQLSTILATTDRTIDDDIAELVTSKGFQIFRGAADDVLSRLIACGERFGLDRIVRISGDSPFIDPHLINEAIRQGDHTGAEVVTNVFPRTYPYGISVEVLPISTLLKIRELTEDLEDREHVTRYVYRCPQAFSIHNIERSKEKLDDLRLVVDTPEDLEFVRAICERLGPRSESAHLETIARVCRALAAET